jgi:methyl-accepting chemotaxis protein
MSPKEAPTATAEQVLREILDVVKQLRDGHLSTHLTDNFPGVGGEIAKALNEHLESLKAYRDQHLRLMEEIGVTGRLGGQVWLPDDLPKCTGAWRDMAEATNLMASNVTANFRDFGNTTRALNRGDAAARATCTFIAGEFGEFREDLNALAERVTPAKV